MSGIAMPCIVPSRALARDGRPGANDRVIIGFIGAAGHGN